MDEISENFFFGKFYKKDFNFENIYLVDDDAPYCVMKFIPSILMKKGRRFLAIQKTYVSATNIYI